MENSLLPGSSSPHAHEPARSQALCDLPRGASCLVSTLTGGREFTARMAVLGFTPGVLVEVVQNYRYGPMIVALRGAHLALGRGEARKVQVQRL